MYNFVMVDNQKLNDFIKAIPQDFINSKETQQMALEAYYASVTNVLQNALDTDEMLALLQKSKNAGGSMQLLRDTVEGFDHKVYEEFSKLIKESVGNSNE